MALKQYGGIPPYVAEAFKEGAASAKPEGENYWGQWWEGKNPSMGAALNQLIKATCLLIKLNGMPAPLGAVIAISHLKL